MHDHLPQTLLIFPHSAKIRSTSLQPSRLKSKAGLLTIKYYIKNQGEITFLFSKFRKFAEF